MLDHPAKAAAFVDIRWTRWIVNRWRRHWRVLMPVFALFLLVLAVKFFLLTHMFAMEDLFLALVRPVQHFLFMLMSLTLCFFVPIPLFRFVHSDILLSAPTSVLPTRSE
jgi:hypothetical protein